MFVRLKLQALSIADLGQKYSIFIIIIITKELIKVTPSQLQTVTGVLYNTLSPVTHQGMTAEKVIV